MRVNKASISIEELAERITDAITSESSNGQSPESKELPKESNITIPQKEEKMKKRLVEVAPEDALKKWAKGEKVIVLKEEDGQIYAKRLADLLDGCRTLAEEGVAETEDKQVLKKQVIGCIAKGMTVAETAEEVGVSKSSVYKWIKEEENEH